MTKVKIGTQFRWTHADSNPLWEVKKARGKGTWECVVIDDLDWQGTRKVFSTEEISGSIGMAALWQKSGDESNDFYNQLPVGSIVHYHNAFGAFVRCQVTDNKQLLPFALVGDWKPFDLPRRLNDGTIELGYYAKKIKERTMFRPHASNVYEYNVNRKPNQQPIHFSLLQDPRQMAPVSLEVPEMSVQEVEYAKLWKKIENLRSVLNTAELSPYQILDNVEKVLQQRI